MQLPLFAQFIVLVLFRRCMSLETCSLIDHSSHATSVFLSEVPGISSLSSAFMKQFLA